MSDSIYFPLFINLEEKLLLIVGGGNVATRKAKLFKKAKARIRVIAPDISQELMKLADECIFEEASEKHFTPDIFLVVLATNNRQKNLSLAQIAKEKKILCNVVDSPKVSDLWTGATFIKLPIIGAVITSGLPSFSKLLAKKFTKIINNNLRKVLKYLLHKREKIIQLIPSRVERAIFWNEIAKIIFKNIGCEKNIKKIDFNYLLSLANSFIKNFSRAKKS